MFEGLLKELALMTSGVQILSLIAAILILSSFVCHGEKKIRIVNMFGSVFAIIYCPLTNPPQWSNLILNLILFSLNAFYLLKGNNKKDSASTTATE